MAVEVKCCKYNGDPRVIDKKPELIKTLQCRMTNDQDVINQIIYVSNEDDIIDCNYFVIGFRKYFKIKDIRKAGNRIGIMLHEDVLSTWMPKVNVTGYILRASKTRVQGLSQDYEKLTMRKISRIKINNEYSEITGMPAIIVQSPLPSVVQSPTV